MATCQTVKSRHTLLNRVKSNLERSVSERGDCLPWIADAGQVDMLLLYLFCLWFVLYQLVVACYIQPVLLEFRENKTLFFHSLKRETHLHWLYIVSQFRSFFYTRASKFLSYSTFEGDIIYFHIFYVPLSSHIKVMLL